MHDKWKSCAGCPDRTVYSIDADKKKNCHMTCEGYLYRQQQNEEKKKKRAEEKEYDNFHKLTVWKMKEIMSNRKKG